jgi:hypothetical protein
MDQIRLLDVVALTEDRPEHGLARGQVGTVVAELGANAYEVEFCDDRGQTYAILGIEKDKLMVLHFRPVAEA